MSTFVNSTIVNASIVNRKLVLPAIDAFGKEVSEYAVTFHGVYALRLILVPGEYPLSQFMFGDGLKPFSVKVECDGSSVIANVGGVLKEKHNRFVIRPSEIDWHVHTCGDERDAELVGSALQGMGLKVFVGFEDGYDDDGEYWGEWRVHSHRETDTVQECPEDCFEGYDPYKDAAKHGVLPLQDEDDDEAYLGESVFARIAREKAAKAAMPSNCDPITQYEMYPED